MAYKGAETEKRTNVAKNKKKKREMHQAKY